MIALRLKPTSSGLDMTYYREIAQSDPTLALAGLRIELEIILNNVAVGFKVEQKRAEPVGSLLKRLSTKGAITSEQMDLARKIFAICNLAIHGTAVTQEQAVEVIDLADVLAKDFLAWLSWGFDDNWRPTEVAHAD
jgi:hypothetical protein